MMKRILLSLFAVFILSATVAAQQQLVPYSFMFTGKWNPSEDPLLLEENGLQDIQNVRKVGNRFKGVSGHTKINTTALSSYPYIVNGYHFKKDQPAESHIVVYAVDSAASPTAGRIYQNTTAIPTAGDFSGTVLYTPTTFTDMWRFSSAPDGNMVASDGNYNLVWGGSEIPATAFLTSSAVVALAPTNQQDYSEVLDKNTTSNSVSIAKGVDDYSKLLLHMNGTDGSTTFTDSLTSPKTPSSVDGNAQIDTSYYKLGTASGLFDGDGDSITYADHADWQLGGGTGAFTLSFWTRFNALPGTNKATIFYSQRTDASNAVILVLRNIQGSYYLTLIIKTSGTYVAPIVQAAWTTPVVNTWYHIALIRGWGGNADSWSICVDGTSIYSQTLSTTVPNLASSMQIANGTVENISTYPYGFSTTYVKATTADASYAADNATDPASTLTGGASSNSWRTTAPNVTKQRFHIDLGSAQVVKRIYYENYHESGSNTDRGADMFSLWGSNEASAFAELTYGTDTNWTHIVTNNFHIHAAANTADPKYIAVPNTTAYRYYAIKIENNHGGTSYLGIRRLELNTTATEAFNGWLDEYHISNGIARWTSNFTPHTRELTTASNYFLVGSKRPLQGVKIYVKVGNSIASTLTVKEWQGTNWTTLSVTDNTDTGAALAQTGTVTWTATGQAKPRLISNMSLYWYQFYLDAGGADLYYITTDAPIQEITNVWSGYTEPSSNAIFNGKNYTADLGDEDASSYADLSSATSSQYLYMGFTQPQQGIEFYMAAGYENATTATTTVSYWNGTAWTAVIQQRDGTSVGGATLAQYGIISFSPQTDEVKTSISSDENMYYYRIAFSTTIDSTVRVTEARGIPYPEPITAYKFSETFQNRLFLFNEKSSAKNRAIYSDYNAPEIYNGYGSGSLTFGDLTDLTAATVIYNVFMSTAVDMMIITKTNETWRLSGANPSEWVLQRMSSNIGCVAPLSMVSAEVSESSANVKRTIAIWQYDKGVVMTDGAIIVPISDDIKCYWDANDSRYIPATMQSKSVAWYDIQNQSYKLLIASGSSATYLNTELEYSLKTKEWTKIYRENAAGANPLQSGFRVYDTNGLSYTYGGGKDGFMYRLENGNDWAGVADITQYLHTKDLILDNERPMFRKSNVRHIRTMYKKKTAATGNLTITHYGDRGSASATGSAGQVAPTAISTVPTTFYNSQSVTLGPFLTHSFKFTQTTDAADGLELLGFGIYYEPMTTFRP